MEREGSKRVKGIERGGRGGGRGVRGGDGGRGREGREEGSRGGRKDQGIERGGEDCSPLERFAAMLPQ
ncbi:MAG: hypothetical protein DYG93_03690 [Leptolyngbya sp. PLA2]|nr:hypothetical protein [Leptolyngbya sp.]MCE7970756.1 hypothetical protein [Leptolyngbya sp. PL-A2]MCQ3939911.1 hypothetical protein [cyanobacterium CYA1]MDL1903344.1 hypothetical protein [Synechococcales cyanobacterium CNB]